MAKAKYTYNKKRKEWVTLVYDGTLNPDGSKHRKQLSSKKSSADLERKVIAFKLDIENNAAAPSTITFGEYAQRWLETSKATRELNTKRFYETVLRSCFNSINDIQVSKLTHSHFQMCINEKADHPRTCQTLSLTFKQIIKSAVRDHLLPRTALEDILEDISLPKYVKPQKRALTDLEKEAIRNADLEPKKRAFIALLYYCGIRKGEALALTPRDFDWENKTLSISKSWVSYHRIPSIKPYPKSDNGIRVVPIPDVAIPQIKPYVDSCDNYIFHAIGKELMNPDSYKRMWESILTRLNMAVGYTPHSIPKMDRPIDGLTAHILRHNYCTELCYQVPLISTKKIAQLLGDDEKMVLEVYSHIVEDKEQPALAINNIFS